VGCGMVEEVKREWWRTKSWRHLPLAGLKSLPQVCFSLLYTVSSCMVLLIHRSMAKTAGFTLKGAPPACAMSLPTVGVRSCPVTFFDRVFLLSRQVVGCYYPPRGDLYHHATSQSVERGGCLIAPEVTCFPCARLVG